MMWLLEMKLYAKPIADLSEASNAQGGFCTALFLPNTQDILEEREVMVEEHDAQENLAYLELDAQKLGRANTKVLCTKNIYHRSTVEGGCANISAAVLTVVNFDTEATEQARKHFLPFPPSSPCIGLFKDGKLVHFVERHHIEGRSGELIADNLKAAFEEYC